MSPDATRDLDLNLLVALHVLLEEQNVSRAAERLRVGQPAMSSTLKRLRTTFGDPLLVRKGRGLVRTPAADDLVEPVAEALGRFETILGQRHVFDPATSRSTFTILTSDFVALILLQPLMQRLVEIAPHIRLQTRDLSPDFADRLRGGSAELAILPSAVASDTAGLHEQFVFRDRYVYLADPDNERARGARTWEDFALLSHVGYSGEELPAVAQVEFDRLAGLHGHDITTETFLLSAYLVQKTHFVCLAPSRLARLAAERFDLVTFEPPANPTMIDETAFWSERTARDPANRWLRAQIHEVGKNMV
ncbi:hypothetical protein CH251_05365 [Rhodococcus sp. 06-462-5]|uniref:LysR family transcriptional regulator n=1 Tax=unclassified Rhodococcus (in: high G+C Gram-positive bacteria) TaxID=192944 RepID=UPI000B9BFA55|nr:MULTISPECIES: LysR family transcriptional regulator [unclassified Rhodococcus (in: high G+C Gram-positive bacteria)]OZC77222.1 hypothetical protein CH251_05365 [Rhodococcus sp. 06-462-5]OZE63379.1 hypothetical protein CH270_17945 [Rhodococcus sp. 02-925g]